MSMISSRFISGAIGLLLLSACGSNSTPTATTSPTAESAASTAPTESTSPTPTQSPDAQATTKSEAGATPAHGFGGQVVETGNYHLEFLTAQEANGVHLDLFLQKGTNHTPVENAKITAQLQLPDGTQQSVDLPYKSDGKHYGALLSNPKPGDYQVAVQTTIDGEPIRGRFNFTVK